MLIESQSGMDLYEMKKLYVSRETDSDGNWYVFCDDQLFGVYGTLERAKTVIHCARVASEAGRTYKFPDK